MEIVYLFMNVYEMKIKNQLVSNSQYCIVKYSVPHKSYQPNIVLIKNWELKR